MFYARLHKSVEGQVRLLILSDSIKLLQPTRHQPLLPIRSSYALVRDFIWCIKRDFHRLSMIIMFCSAHAIAMVLSCLLVFERVYLVTRQLVSMTQQARAAFQYATLNVFQVSSRQASQTSSNVSQSSNSMGVTQLQGMSQAKSSSVHRLGSSMRTTP